MKPKQTTLIIIALILSYSAVQAQSILNERVREIQQRTIPQFKSDFNGKNGFRENDVESPRSFIWQSADSVLERIVLENFEDEAWINSIQESFTYNDRMLVSELIISEWVIGSWENTERFIYQYNSAI